MSTRRNLIVATALIGAAIAVSATVQHSTSKPTTTQSAKESTPKPNSDHATALKARHASETPTTTAASEPKASTQSASKETQHGSDVEAIWTELMTGNQRFVAGHPAEKPWIETRKRLAGGQHPKAIVLACADSRVAPELIFDQGLGELFVVRVAGNVADPAALGSIEYAVEHLHCGLLVVVGHEKCGAVSAAASGSAMPTVNLTALVERISPSLEQLRLCAEGDQLVQMGVRMNAHGSACALINESPIVEHALESGELAIFTAVYDLESGNVRRLPTSPCVEAHVR